MSLFFVEGNLKEIAVHHQKAYQDRTTSWDSRGDSGPFDDGDHDRGNNDFRDDDKDGNGRKITTVW